MTEKEPAFSGQLSITHRVNPNERYQGPVAVRLIPIKDNAWIDIRNVFNAGSVVTMDLSPGAFTISDPYHLVQELHEP